MDSILLFGVGDDKLNGYLQRAGHKLHTFDKSMPLANFIVAHLIDLIVLDSRNQADPLELCDILKSEPAAKRLPLIFISKDSQIKSEVESKNFARIEVLPSETSAAVIFGKISTHLRMRKMVGMQGEGSASLAEINAALRDLNAHFTKELEEARSIQQSLLPKTLPVDERFEFAACYKPLEEVGGDWYYATQDEQGVVSAQIADVTGHGLSAAFIGCMTKLALSAIGGNDPGKLLEGVNRLMAPQLPGGRFVTMSAYTYFPDSGEIQIARAGHPPTLILDRATGKMRQLVPDGFPVGFMDSTAYSVEKYSLNIGDMVILFTDGVNEAKNRNNQFYGIERIEKMFAGWDTNVSATQALDFILGDFNGFIDGRLLKDDVTILLLKRLK